MVTLLRTHRHLMYGAVGIFFYVGVISIGSLLVNLFLILLLAIGTSNDSIWLFLVAMFE